jgi:uncharacterized membrane protein YozB (DUF420 family)
MDVHSLPALNAVLNTSSAILLVTGYVFVRAGRLRMHRTMMLAAFACSAMFLTSYLIYHAHVGSVKFAGQGIIRIVYFSILGTHTILAAAIVPLALITLSRALRGRFRKHRTIAVWTFPLWLYVSVTGVVIYLMLYRFYPSI